MGFFTNLSTTLNGGSSSKSSNNSSSGFSLLPSELQGAFKSYAPLLSQFLNPNDAANTERFTPMGLTSGESNAIDNLGQGFTPDAAQLGSDIAMQMNPFDNSVINDINRQADGENSIRKQALSETGQFGSNRDILGANDVDMTRLNLIGRFKQDQYNTALNNSLNTLTNSRRADASGALTGGSYARELDTQTKQAPINALTTFGKLLTSIPESGGSVSSGSSSSSSENGMGKNLAALALAMSDHRLKENIKAVGKKNGFNIYEFNYLWSPIKYIGVMAQEIKKLVPSAIHEVGGYMAVDYSKLGFNMVRV